MSLPKHGESEGSIMAKITEKVKNQINERINSVPEWKLIYPSEAREIKYSIHDLGQKYEALETAYLQCQAKIEKYEATFDAAARKLAHNEIINNPEATLPNDYYNCEWCGVQKEYICLPVCKDGGPSSLLLDMNDLCYECKKCIAKTMTEKFNGIKKGYLETLVKANFGDIYSEESELWRKKVAFQTAVNCYVKEKVKDHNTIATKLHNERCEQRRQKQASISN